MPPVGFEPTILAGGQLQTYALDRAATGTGSFIAITDRKNYIIIKVLRFRWFLFVYIPT